uniref:hypothetical protein n=1 Tax=Parerythrobacter lutipelagi TaxID=1964208 RepID=UPI0010F982C3|nr:hypothetical protein [Parerythrobacter lutipelagi]
MLYFLARCFVCILLFCAPLLAMMASSGDPAMGMLLLIPMIGLIPALIMALLLFVPVEALTGRMGLRWLANVLVPIMGVVGAGLCLLVLAAALGASDAMARNFAQQPWAFYFWLAMGALWGVVWRLTALVGRLPLFTRRASPA